MPLGKGGPLVLSSIQTLPLQLCCVYGYLVELMYSDQLMQLGSQAVTIGPPLH